MNADNRKTVYGIAEVIGKPDDTFGEVVEAVFVFVSTNVLLFHHRIFSQFFCGKSCFYRKCNKRLEWKAFIIHFGLGHIYG